MAEFQDVMRQWARRVKDSCQHCPIDQCCRSLDYCSTCPVDMIVAKVGEIEAEIITWAAEHPEPVYPTWEEWLLDNGVFAPDNVLINGKCRNILAKKIYDPIPADIAEKLGIEPKE